MHKIEMLCSRKPWISTAALLILILALTLRVAHLASESVDGDELFSRRVALADTSRAWIMARQDLVHPPLYYFLLKATIPSGGTSTPFDIRCLSLIAGAITIMVVVAIGFAAPEIRLPTLLAALLLALNKVHIFYSQQARSYALYTALVAVLLLWRVVADRYWERPWYWVSGTILMTAITWTHYVGALFCAACVLSMTFTGFGRVAGRARRLRPIAAMLVSAVLFLPWLVPEMRVYRQRAGISGNLEWQGLPTAFDLKATFADYVGTPHFRGATTLAFLAGALLLCCAFLPRTVAEPAAGAGIKRTLATMAVAPPALLWLLARPPLDLPIFGERHLLPAIVPMLILLCCGLTRVAYLARGPIRGGRVFALGLVILCGFEAAPVCHDWPGPIREPYSEIARDLQQPGFELPVYTTWPYGIGEPVKFYLHGGNRTIYGLPQSERDTLLPARVIVLYRPAAAKEDAAVQPLMRQYEIVSSRYYGAVGSTYGTRLLVLSKR
jgi:hypothetical protein